MESAVVYLFLVYYGRSKAEQIHLVIPSFLQVSGLGLKDSSVLIGVS